MNGPVNNGSGATEPTTPEPSPRHARASSLQPPLPAKRPSPAPSSAPSGAPAGEPGLGGGEHAVGAPPLAVSNGSVSRAAGGGEAGVSLQRATFWMAVGTGVSRLTGVLRVVALAAALGPTALADGYNLANTAPNMLYDIVLGGVLSATFIPVFVERLSTKSEREAWRAISAVISLSIVVLGAATIVFWLAAPLVITAVTALDPTHSAVAATITGHERAAATSLLRWFVPQIFFYGLISLTTALLNARRRFVAPMWVPIANNVVCIAVLLWFRHEVARPSLTGIDQDHHLVLLGLGTTLGVVAQALILLVGLRGRHYPLLRWRWDPGHEAVRAIVALGSWTFGFVVANQVALFIALALAGSTAGADPVSSYTYAYTFLQMPYAVVAVSIMSAVTPDLAARWSARDLPAFRRRLTGGLRAVLAIILPASVGMLLLARPAVALLLAHGSTSVTETQVTGDALAMFALGLPGFCTFLFVVRVLQAMQRARTAFWLYLLENSLNIALAVLLVHVMGVRGLALSLSVAYSVGAVVGVVVLRRWLGPLANWQSWAPLRPVAACTLVMAAVVLVVSNLTGSTTLAGLALRVLGAIAAGGIAFAGTATLLGRHAAKIRRRPVWIAGTTPGPPRRRP